MTINEILELILQTILLPLILYVARLLRNYIRAKIRSAEIQGTLDLAVSAVASAVGETAQTFVDDLKAAGEFTPEKAREAFERSKERALEILGDAGIEMLIKITGDAEKWIDAKIEELVRETRTPQAWLLDEYHPPDD